MAKRDKKLITELRSGKMSAPAPGDQRQVWAQHMDDMADQLVNRTETKIRADGILQSPHIVEVFAVACAKSIIKWRNNNPALASDLAATALRVIIKNMRANGVTIPNLNMESWIPPNIHWGTDRKH